jgi:putative hemolysin
MISPRDRVPAWPDLRPGTELGEKMLASTPLYGIGRVAEKLLSLDQLDDVYSQVCRGPRDQSFFSNLLDRLHINCDCPDQELARIPAEGPLIVVANHPFGLVEPTILASLLLKKRTDIRFLANSLLANIEFLRDYLIAVDPFGGKDATRLNFRGLRSAVEWLQSGGSLVVFPAGEVSSLQFPHFRVADAPWSDSIGRVARITSSTVIPVYFHGANGAGFQMAGLVHPRLRTALLPREFFNKRGRTIHVSIGQPVLPYLQSRFSDHRLTAYLRMRTELLQTRSLQPGREPRVRTRQASPILAPTDVQRMRDEVERIPEILHSGPLRVCVTEANQIPHVLREIGRLREVTFRAVGEGTGGASDLDRFDRFYRHLFVWNEERGEIVGAYRIGLVDSILADHGLRGLYTSTLFRFDRTFLAKLGPAIELGRSFVRPEYQREYLPLLLLWKGICHFVARNPRLSTVFGPVSISNDYRAISRALMVEFFNSEHDPQFGGSVQPKCRFQPPSLPGCDPDAWGSLVEDVKELSELVADLEPDKKGVPVLIRQYLHMGGKILAFNLDAKFGNAVDGLIVVDLLKADARLLSRYMGADGLASFYRYHGREPRELAPCSVPTISTDHCQ